MPKNIEYKAVESHFASGFVQFISSNNFTHFRNLEPLLAALRKDKQHKAVYYQLPTGFWAALIKPEQEEKHAKKHKKRQAQG